MRMAETTIAASISGGQKPKKVQKKTCSTAAIVAVAAAAAAAAVQVLQVDRQSPVSLLLSLEREARADLSRFFALTHSLSQSLSLPPLESVPLA